MFRVDGDSVSPGPDGEGKESRWSRDFPTTVLSFVHLVQEGKGCRNAFLHVCLILALAPGLGRVDPNHLLSQTELSQRGQCYLAL